MIRKSIKTVYKYFAPYQYAKRYKDVISFDFGKRDFALLSYIQQPFAYKDQAACKATHANFAAAWEIVYVLRDMGFNVDVAEASGKNFLPEKDYSLVIGTLNCIDRFKPFLSEKCITIFYALGVHVDVRNGPDGELHRVQNLENRTGRHYTPKRLFDNPEGIRRSLDKANHVIITGGQATYDTFPEHIKRKSSLCTMPIYQETIPPKIAASLAKRREFLWFFGYGQVHKGLDLVIEVFLRNSSYTLNIIGSMEPDFELIYGTAIREAKNIHYHGYLDTRGAKFQEVTDRCFSFIAPTVNEGISCACVTSIRLGLYPIMTESSGVDLPQGLGITLKECSIGEIENAVEHALSLSTQELASQLSTMIKLAEEHYSPRRFYVDFSSSVASAIEMRR